MSNTSKEISDIYGGLKCFIQFCQLKQIPIYRVHCSNITLMYTYVSTCLSGSSRSEEIKPGINQVFISQYRFREGRTF